jgi:2-oxoisovalerate dehydrogenase E1 component
MVGVVRVGYYTIPRGWARGPRPGRRLTLVTYGAGVHWAIEAAAARKDDAVEVIDLRSLLPWDETLVFESVKKTNRCLVLHEDTLFGGLAGEIAATIGEEMFEYLDAPIMRLGALETPVPFNASLEKQFLPRRRVAAKIAQLLAY